MKKKLLITLSVVACAVLLVVGSIAGTIAYLTSTQTVTNTFTVGDVTITMTETDVDGSTSGQAGTGRDVANTYKLIPGKTYTKDPVIYVGADSESCYLFVKITNGMAAIETDEEAKTVIGQMKEKGWVAFNAAEGVYYKTTAVNAGAEVSVFDTVTVSGTVNNTTLATYDASELKVVAYAIQAEGLTADQAGVALGFIKA